MKSILQYIFILLYIMYYKYLLRLVHFDDGVNDKNN